MKSKGLYNKDTRVEVIRDLLDHKIILTDRKTGDVSELNLRDEEFDMLRNIMIDWYK